MIIDHIIKTDKPYPHDLVRFPENPGSKSRIYFYEVMDKADVRKTYGRSTDRSEDSGSL